MKELVLSQGKVALVDDEDFSALSQWKWYFHKGYVVRKVYSGKERQVYLHRQILGVDGVSWKEKLVDHINLNRMDNRRVNLRISDPSLNQANRGLRSSNKSGFKGVCARHGKWLAQISFRGKKSHLGYFDNPADAAKAYDAAAVRIFGEFALVNSWRRRSVPAQTRSS